MGRRIHDNLRKAMIYIVAIHIPIAVLAMVPLLGHSPIILTPMLIALLEMVIDPTCSIIIEAEGDERDIMQRPPASPDAELLPAGLLVWGGLQGGFAAGFITAVYMLAQQAGLPEDEVRALSFLSLMLASLSLVLVNRSFGTSLRRAFMRPNPLLGWGIGLALMIFGLIMFWPPLRELFSLGILHGHDVTIALGLAIMLFVVLELVKRPFVVWLHK